LPPSVLSAIVSAMPIAHPGPPKFRPTPPDGPELQVHAQRAPPGITACERALVCIFLRRYVIWCAKARRFDRLRNSLDLLVEVAGGWRTSGSDCGLIDSPI
jgi:hypothetical protein